MAASPQDLVRKAKAITQLTAALEDGHGRVRSASSQLEGLAEASLHKQRKLVTTLAVSVSGMRKSLDQVEQQFGRLVVTRDTGVENGRPDRVAR